MTGNESEDRDCYEVMCKVRWAGEIVVFVPDSKLILSEVL